jgi:hypothetical protein
MENVAALLKHLNLSEEEKGGVKLGWSDGGKIGAVEAQALGKLLSEKPAMTEALKNSVGKVWCPLKGVSCKDLGENTFRFTFHQASGKRKALEEGPWMFDGDALIMEDFDASKTTDEYEFASVPIWIRVANLPLGKLDKDTGETIGNKVGEFIEVELGEDGMAKGKVLRVKVRLNIKKPLMRGVLVQIGEEKTERWCPLEYEFLPSFCWTCGVIGHVDRGCSIILKKGEKQQYGEWLKFKPERKKSYDEPYRLGSGQRRDSGRFVKSGNSGGKPGSDSLSWRKETEQINGEKISEKDDGEGTRPMKLTDGREKEGAVPGNAKNQLSFAVEGGSTSVVCNQGEAKQGLVEANEKGGAVTDVIKQLGTNASMIGGPEAMQAPIPEPPQVDHVNVSSTGNKILEEKKLQGTYKKLKANDRKGDKRTVAGGEAMEGVVKNNKRWLGLEDTDEKITKKQKGDVEMSERSEITNTNAGLHLQPGESQ